jgi:hypothetical protein
MTIDEYITNGIKKVQNMINYEGDRLKFNENIKKTIGGTATIILMNKLNAPDILNTAAWLYTTYHGFKSYKDYLTK